MRPSYALAALIVCFVIFSAVNVGYSGYLQRRSDQRFCAVVGTTVRGYEEAPPTTEVGRAQQRNFRELFERLGCNER